MAESVYEVEIRIRRKGRLIRRENAFGDTALTALENASNDLLRELAAATDTAVHGRRGNETGCYPRIDCPTCGRRVAYHPVSRALFWHLDPKIAFRDCPSAGQRVDVP